MERGQYKPDGIKLEMKSMHFHPNQHEFLELIQYETGLNPSRQIRELIKEFVEKHPRWDEFKKGKI
jgi:hypothetical protein